MIIGRWSTRALGELRPYDNDVIVFLPDSTGWMYAMNKRTWYTNTFIWKYNANGSLFIEGKTYEYMDEEAKTSNIYFKELFYKIDDVSSGRIITFTSPLSNGHFVFGLDDDDVPDLVKEKNKVERIQEQIKFLHWYTPRSISERASKDLVKMDDQYLTLLLQPLGKAYWDNAALVLSSIEHTRLEPIIPGLIEWMYDLNWPGALSVAELLCNIGKPIIPHLKQYLMGKDEQLISGILSEIVENWPKEYVKHLKNELVQLTLRADSHEYVYRTAKEILEELKIIKDAR